jgi:hypothetical protein
MRTARKLLPELALVGCMAVLLSCSRGGEGRPPVYESRDQYRQAVETVVNDFHARTAALGHPLEEVPGLKFDSDTGLLTYSFFCDDILLPFWNDLSPAARALYEMATPPGENAETVFTAMNLFVLPHELGHELAHKSGCAPENRYQSEFMANRVGVAYWVACREEARLRYVERVVTYALPRFAGSDPVPAGIDREAYFDSHYRELQSRPASMCIASCA